MSVLKLIHANCPGAKTEGEWRSPEFIEKENAGGFVMRFECPVCRLYISVNVMRDSTVARES